MTYLEVLYLRGTQIPGARSPRRLKFVQWRLMFVVLSMELYSCHPSGPQRGVPCVFRSGNKVRLTAVRHGGNRIIPVRCPVCLCVCMCVCVCSLRTQNFDLQYHTVVLVTVTYFTVPPYFETLGHFEGAHKFIQLLRVLQHMDGVR
jgi:hypothetical protein